MQHRNSDNSEPEQIILPLVNTNEENVVFPLVVNVMTRFWGEELPTEEIEKRSRQYGNYRGTIFIEGLEIIEKKLGLSSIIYRGSLDDLKKRISQGFPVIVILPGIGETVQFATIVNGYDEEENRIITYVPEPDSYGAIPVEKFNDEWSQDDFFSILIFPKDMGKVFEKDIFPFEKSNRLYLESERLRVLGKVQESIDLLSNYLNHGISEDNGNQNPQILCMLAGILNEINDKRCVELYKKTIQLNSKFYLAYRGLGNFYLKSKNYQLSKDYYSKAIKINPMRFGPIYKNLGIAYMNLGDNASAKVSFEKYLNYVPNAADKEGIMQFVNS